MSVHLQVDQEPLSIRTKNGYAKLADFGLAKLEKTPLPQDVTQTLAATRPGMIVGTIAYMSPEQASGKPLDARSDIFSFGVVLYETVSGRRPFACASELELLQSIIHAPPHPLPEAVPSAVRSVIEKSLEKDPGSATNPCGRWSDRAVRAQTRQMEAAAMPAKLRSRRGWRWAAALVLLAAVAAGVILTLKHLRARHPISSIAVLPFENLSNKSEQEWFSERDDQP